MIKKLQVKFVVINMTMVTVMLCVIFGMVYHFTRVNLEAESISMMRAIASNPVPLGGAASGKGVDAAKTACGRCLPFF